MARRIGLVGCGKWGKNILRDLILLGCEVYVADRNPEVCERAKHQGAREVYPSVYELPDCDAYVVAVKIPELAVVCAELLKREKPIFAEKTLCTSIEIAEDLERLGADKFIFAMHKWHYHPGIEELRKIARSGQIGQLKEIFCFRHTWTDDFHGGDIYWSLGVHDLTIVKHILGYIPDEIIYSKVLNDNNGLAFSLTAILGKDPSANICINGHHAEKLSAVTLQGDKGTAMLKHALDDCITLRNTIVEQRIKIDTTFPLYIELKEFINYLNGGKKPRCSFQDAKEITRSLLAIKDYTKG